LYGLGLGYDLYNKKLSKQLTTLNTLINIYIL